MIYTGGTYGSQLKKEKKFAQGHILTHPEASGMQPIRSGTLPQRISPVEAPPHELTIRHELHAYQMLSYRSLSSGSRRPLELALLFRLDLARLAPHRGHDRKHYAS